MTSRNSNNDDRRPDPDALLKKIKRQDAAANRGRLRIYLGAAPGVGKTYAMLQEGRRRAERGTDVVVGYVETYERPLTKQALEGLEVISRRRIEYHGVVLEEMDTDAVIARRPQVALVDELAHTNAAGSKHEKRWQDVYDLLDARITVISTLNIQHLESLNDVVAGVTGIKVRETVPDKVVDDADEVEVVDISPQALRSRMRHGNIYPPGQSERALEGFFREGNLDALRELVLKRVVHEVEQDLTEYMREHGLQEWEAAERCIVILENTPDAEVALRRALRMARAFNGDLTVVYPACLLKEQGMTHLLAVARDLNIALREIAGEDFMREISDLIRAENIVHVTLLAGHERHFLGLRRVSLADAILASHPHVGVHLVGRAGG